MEVSIGSWKSYLHFMKYYLLWIISYLQFDEILSTSDDDLYTFLEKLLTISDKVIYNMIIGCWKLYW